MCNNDLSMLFSLEKWLYQDIVSVSEIAIIAALRIDYVALWSYADYLCSIFNVLMNWWKGCIISVCEDFVNRHNI